MPRHTPSIVGTIALMTTGFLALSLACFGDTDPEIIGDDPPPPQDALSDPSPSAEALPWVRVIPNTPRGTMIVGADEIAYHCQPELFVPDEARIEKDPRVPPYSRIVDDEREGRFLTVDRSAEGLSLPAGMSVQRYDFLCEPNTEDQVLEFLQDGARKALFTHVTHSSPSPNGKRLFMVNHVKNKDGTWKRLARILDLHSFSTKELAPATCVGWRTEWHPGGLLTLGSNPEWVEAQDVCLWDANGEQIGHVQFEGGMNSAAGVPSVDPPMIYVASRQACRSAVIDVDSGTIRVNHEHDDEMLCIEAAGTPAMTPADFRSYGEVLP